MPVLLLLVALGIGGTGAYFAFTKLKDAAPDRPAAPERADLESIIGEPVASTSPTFVGQIASDLPVSVLVTLPEMVKERPNYRVMSFVETSREVGSNDGVPFTQDIVLTAEVDYVTPIAQFRFNFAGVNPGDRSAIQTSDSFYASSPVYGAPWSRSPRVAEAVGLYSPSHVEMYHEVVTPQVLAAATAVVETKEFIGEVPVTTYSFDVPASQLEPFATTDAEAQQVEAVLGEGLMNARVTLSVDADGLLRVYDIRLDEQAWVQAIAISGREMSFFVSLRTEVLSTSNEPSTITPPVDFVDE